MQATCWRLLEPEQALDGTIRPQIVGGMGMRASVGLLFLLPGCCYGYFVGRHSHDVGAIDPRMLQMAAEGHPLVQHVHAWDGSWLRVHLRRGDAMAVLDCAVDTGSVFLSLHSEWWNRVPDYPTLCASIDLQDEFLRSLSATIPGIPAALGAALVWEGFEAPLGPRFAELKVRYEADHAEMLVSHRRRVDAPVPVRVEDVAWEIAIGCGIRPCPALSVR